MSLAGTNPEVKAETSVSSWVPDDLALDPAAGRLYAIANMRLLTEGAQNLQVLETKPLRPPAQISVWLSTRRPAA